MIPRPRTLTPRTSLRSNTSQLLLVVVMTCILPAGLSAQYSFLGALANRFSDLSFFANIGGLAPQTDQVRADQLSHFGLEILFSVGAVSRASGPTRTPADSVRLVWREMRVEHTAEGVDTINFYDVERTSSVTPREDIWLFEMGLGYGQLTGFEARAPSIQMKGAVRDLPSVSLYANYEPLGSYFGLRSGLMELTGLQVVTEEGASFRGTGKSFLAGALVGHALEVAGFNLFFEASYMLRDFPSVEWGGTPPLGTPFEMDLSGWSFGTGVQFGVGR